MSANLYEQHLLISCVTECSRSFSFERRGSDGKETISGRIKTDIRNDD
jgi:hypothetical protein